MTRYGCELIFISKINSDGKGINPVTEKLTKLENQDIFILNCLSISKGTFIASSMSTYVVKLKNNPRD